jgi:hypothetical protein
MHDVHEKEINHSDEEYDRSFLNIHQVDLVVNDVSPYNKQPDQSIHWEQEYRLDGRNYTE